MPPPLPPEELAKAQVTVTAPVVAPVGENEFDEPNHYPPENAMPDAPVHVMRIENPRPLVRSERRRNGRDG